MTNKIIRAFIWLLLLFPVANAYSQKADCIKGRRFKGYIFSDSIPIFLGIENQVGRFIPNAKEIADVESKLSSRITSLTDQLPDFGSGCPEINNRNLKKYYRQYFGFITTKGEKVIFINFVWHNGQGVDKIDKDLVSVYDGCTFYWNIHYNLNIDTFYGLKVNIRS